MNHVDKQQMGQMGVALIAAGINRNQPEALLDVSGLVDHGKINEATQRSAEQRRFAEAALPKYRELENARGAILASPDWEHNDALAGQVSDIEKRMSELLVNGGPFLKYFLLCDQIERAVTFDEVADVMMHLTTESFTARDDKRYCKKPESWIKQYRSAHDGMSPQGTVQFEGEWYVPFQPDPGHQKTSGMKRVESLVGQMIARYETKRVEDAFGAAKPFPASFLLNKELVPVGEYLLTVPSFKSPSGAIRNAFEVVLSCVHRQRQGKEPMALYEVVAARGFGKRFLDKGYSLKVGEILAREYKPGEGYAPNVQRELRILVSCLRDGFTEAMRAAKNGRK